MDMRKTTLCHTTNGANIPSADVMQVAWLYLSSVAQSAEFLAVRLVMSISVS
jgi:hypothetical protein